MTPETETVVVAICVIITCPGCKGPVDHLGRCWECEDWICRCGWLTGSCLISQCLRCQLESEPAASK